MRHLEDKAMPKNARPRRSALYIPGANTRGTNFVAVHDGLYVIQGGSVSVLDPATGRTLRVISLPPVDPTVRRPKPPPWRQRFPHVSRKGRKASAPDRIQIFSTSILGHTHFNH